ncbi:general transcription factor IIH subunit 2 [Schistocerca piceifrons]|uniref:general transcription factor IIH subunit 2 n=1 Tax=Schistocerca piceifrons TaxID=274613 RepID=UPI001F5EDD51|nr:general transcription factor IIH subunit 2 [Schistocerca piceifrons]
MAEEEETGKEYRWETGYEKTWEAIKEDEEGLLEGSVADIIQRAKRRRQADRRGNVRLGMMRHLYLIVDFSEAMSNQDLKPTRHLCSIKLLESFIDEFFDQNPISQLGIIITRNKRAEKITELAGNPRKHIKAVRQLAEATCSGEPSLQNALELSLRSLRLLPSHASREVLVIFGSLTTCDPGDITVTIESLKKQGVRCSVVGLAAEVHVCRRLSRETGGEFGVVLDDCHYRDQLFMHVEPPPAASCLESSLIKMGFPHHTTAEGKETPLTICMCHLDVPAAEAKGVSHSGAGYFCPQCCSRYCELPVECRACGLTLVSAPHLARSYHHLFPVENFVEMEQNLDLHKQCYACQRSYGDHDKHVYECGRCSQVFCLDCDLFIHDTLHTCPGCATNQQTFHLMGSGDNGSSLSMNLI